MEAPPKYRLFKSLNEPYEYVGVAEVNGKYYPVVIYRKAADGITVHAVDRALPQSTRRLFLLLTGCTFTMGTKANVSCFVDRSYKSTAFKEVTDESFEDIFGKLT